MRVLRDVLLRVTAVSSVVVLSCVTTSGQSCFVQQQCYGQLLYRPIDIRALGLYFTHSFWVLRTTATGTPVLWDISGGPSDLENTTGNVVPYFYVLSAASPCGFKGNDCLGDAQDYRFPQAGTVGRDYGDGACIIANQGNYILDKSSEIS